MTRIYEGKMLFKVRDNLKSFLNGCEEYGMKREDLFTIEQFENGNMGVVLQTLKALSKK